MKPPRWLLLVLPLLSLSFFPPIRSLMAQVAPHFGDPLPGLSDADLAAFAFGKEKFMAVQTPATGLGPVFNGRSCVACHSSPAPGGSGASLDNRVTRFARQVQGQPFDPLLHLGGPNLQKFSVGGELPGCSLPPAGEAGRRRSGGGARGAFSSMTPGRPIWSPPPDCTGERRARFETGSSTCRPSRGRICS